MKYSRLLSPVLALALIVSLLTGCGSGTGGSTWQDQYDLGMLYLSEGNYEEAIIAFTAAIELDPKRPEAYEKAAEAYEALGDMDSAWAVLEQGVQATGDSGLLERFQAQQPLPGYPRTDRIDHEDGGYALREYDQTGLVLSHTEYGADGTTVRTLYTYTPEGFLLRESTEGLDPSTQEEIQQIFDYAADGTGRILHSYERFGGGHVEEVDYTYTGAAVSVRFQRLDPDLPADLDSTLTYTMEDVAHWIEVQGAGYSDQELISLDIQEYAGQRDPMTFVRLYADGRITDGTS